MYLHRTLEPFFKAATMQFPVLLITGPRQVGKTTFLKHLSTPQRTYVTLDDPLMANLAREDPKLFLDRFSPPLLIDEIQYAPELLPFIKMYVDDHKTPGDFWLTGSQQFHLMKNVSESLAGRIGIINMLGFSLWEEFNLGLKAEPFLPTFHFLKNAEKEKPELSLKEIYSHIWRGSFPALSLNKKWDRDSFLGSYLQTYLQRDVRDLAKVGNERSFLKFLRAAAARTGQLLNMTELAKDCDISVSTAKNWLSILETSRIIYLLEPYHTNLTKRLIKTPKLYFLDTGLCSYLTEWSSPQTLEAGAMGGAILETFVFTQILKSYWHRGKRAPLYFYRNKDKQEIDILINQDQTLYPIEIKKTSSPSKSSVKTFHLLSSLPGMEQGPGALVCLIDKMLPFSPSLTAVPLTMIS